MKKDGYQFYPEFRVNTDSVDIHNRQIGIHCSDTLNREFCAGVNHNGKTFESIQEATRIATLFVNAPEMLKELKRVLIYLKAVGQEELIQEVSEVIAKVEKPTRV